MGYWKASIFTLDTVKRYGGDTTESLTLWQNGC